MLNLAALAVQIPVGNASVSSAFDFDTQRRKSLDFQYLLFLAAHNHKVISLERTNHGGRPLEAVSFSTSVVNTPLRISLTYHAVPDCFMDEGPYLETLYSLDREFDGQISPPPSTEFSREGGELLSAELVSFSPHFSESTTAGAEFELFPTRKPLAELPYESLLNRSSKADLQNGVAFPLMQESEVRLMRYYIDYMCHWVS
jgi:hypothetical protein